MGFVCGCCVVVSPTLFVTMRLLLIAFAVGLLCAAATCEESTLVTVTGPYEFEPSGNTVTSLQFDVDRPNGAEGGFLLTSYKMEVLNEHHEVLDLSTVHDDEMYFHHSVLHEWDPSISRVIHVSQVLFLSSADMVVQDKPIQFPEGYGLAWFDSDPAWGLCAHAANPTDETKSLYLRWTITYRPLLPTDNIIAVEFLGKKLGRRELADADFDDIIRTVTGRVHPAHAPAEVVAVQWHLHDGISRGVLALERHGVREPIFVVEQDPEEGLSSNGIEIYDLLFTPGLTINAEDKLSLTTVSDPEVVLNDIRERDLLMMYTLNYISYADNWRHHGNMLYLNTADWENIDS